MENDGESRLGGADAAAAMFATGMQLQQATTHCNMLQHAATCCNTLHHSTALAMFATGMQLPEF